MCDRLGARRAKRRRLVSQLGKAISLTLAKRLLVSCYPSLSIMRYLVVLVLLLSTAACDSGGSDPCPTGPGPDYLPGEIGDVWSFDTEFGTSADAFGPAIRTSGLTTWTFRDVSCESGIETYTITEVFEGEREQPNDRSGSSVTLVPVRIQRALAFTTGESISLDRYTLAPIPLPSNSPADTLRARQETGLRAGSRGQTLVRGRGVVRVSYSQTVSASGRFEYERLARTD